MSKTEELLAVLDLPKEEQFDWLFKRGIVDDSIARSQVTDKIVPHWCDIELADLAFRLRDEVVAVDGNAVKLNLGMWYVYRRVQYQDHRFDYPPCGTEQGLASGWFAYYAKPIHWILASLIAKELSNADRSKKM